MKRLLPVLATSLVTLGIVGCGPEELDAGSTEGDAVGETAQAGDPRRCVNIVQRHDDAALGYSSSSNQVFTDPFWRAPDVRFTWCLWNGNGGDRYRIYPYDFQNTKELDAYETSSNDYNVVLRPKDGNDPSKVWRIRPDFGSYPFVPVSGAVRISQLTTDRYVDAYTSSTNRRAVTRTYQHDDTQRWYVEDAGCTCDPI